MKINQRNYTTILLCITVAFLFADQNLLSPNLTAIAREFHFSDAERDAKLGGNISFGFFVLGAPAALLVGYLTDSYNRCKLFGIVVILGEFACFGTYWVRTYPELFACRVLTGISIGGAAPVIFSLLADYWPGSSRVQVSTLVGISMSAGIAFGQLIAGLMGPTYGWRSPFLLVAIPCLIFGMLILLTSAEPVRGGQEEEVLIMRRARDKFLMQKEQWDLQEDGIISKDNDIENKDTENKDTTKDSKVSENTSITKNPLQSQTPPNKYQDASNHTTAFNTKHDSIKFSAIYTEGKLEENNFNNKNKRKSVESKYNRCVLPLQSQTDDVHYSEKIDCNKVYRVFLTPTVALIFIQGIPGCLPWGKDLGPIQSREFSQ